MIILRRNFGAIGVHRVQSVRPVGCGQQKSSLPNERNELNPFCLFAPIGSQRIALAAVLAVLGIAIGCSQSTPEPLRQVEQSGGVSNPTAASIEADPVGFLEEVAQKAGQLDEYKLTFYRQERQGLFAQLGPMEKIDALFRADPFSVKFTWDNPERSYYESIYVEGKYDNQMLVRERHGFSFFPPQVRKVDVMLPVKLGLARNPITSFGLAQVVRRSLEPFHDPEIRKVMTIEYQGIVELPPENQKVYHLHIERPTSDQYRYTRQDIFVHTETLLPAGTDLYTPGPKLDARYRYTNVDPDVELTDADFRLVKDHPAEENE